MKKFFLLLLTSLSLVSLAGAWPGSNPSRVVLQAFWWDYWNNNYQNGWYNYLTELAPRLKSMGVDAVWIPPTSKGGGGTNDVGYGIFDHYDLGDKYQKGNVKTRLGTKDEYLRMVAVMHANGIDVIQDVVLNHSNGTGGLGAVEGNDKGGKDPNAISGWDEDNPWKNFRYTSFATPATDESKNDYLNRSGRWFKNWQNFNRSGSPNWGFNDYSYPLHKEMFGPDISYSQSSINTNGARSTAATYGLATIYDPNQSAGYMKQQAIEWGVWMKKQSGIDGVRLDATKHFEWDVTEAFLYNLQWGSGFYGSKKTWANGGDNMWAVAEYIPEGGQPSMENHIDGVQGRTGTFDFNLRDQVYNMVSGDGFYDVSAIPGGQISSVYRNRTVNFVNNHDTFRPRLNNGNYAGWYDGVHEASEPDDYPQDPDKWEDSNELRKHIDPFGRLVPAAYALSAAVDGSLQVFFEDVFNISNSNRFNHNPTLSDNANLPARGKIANIIWAKRAIVWETAAYKVRTSEAGVFFNPGSSKNDLIAIERSGKAVIAVNDNGSSDQSAWIDTDFQPGTQIKDYSGNTGYTYTVDASKRIQVIVPKAVKDAQGNVTGGYVIIAKTGFDGFTFNPVSRTTTQEWEMAEDLGDSHVNSLKQGGAVKPFLWYGSIQSSLTKQPMQYVGKVFAKGGTTVTIEVKSSDPGKNLFAQIPYQYRPAPGVIVQQPFFYYTLKSGSGQGSFSFTYTPTSDGWVSIGVGNNDIGTIGSNTKIPAFVKVTYTAPSTVNTKLFAKEDATETSNPDTETPSEFSLEPNFPNPFNPSTTLKFTLPSDMHVKIVVFNALGQQVSTVADQDFKAGKNAVNFEANNLSTGVYFYKVITTAGTKTGKMMLMK